MPYPHETARSRNNRAAADDKVRIVKGELGGDELDVALYRCPETRHLGRVAPRALLQVDRRDALQDLPTQVGRRLNEGSPWHVLRKLPDGADPACDVVPGLLPGTLSEKVAKILTSTFWSVKLFEKQQDFGIAPNECGDAAA